MTPAFCASFLDSILSPIAAIALGGGPMKAISALASALAKLSRSRQEAVARMHRLGAGRLARVDDQLGLEVGFRRRRRPEPDALVGHLHMRRARVGVGIDRDGLDPHAPRGADHPARNLAAIGDQDFLEHQSSFKATVSSLRQAEDDQTASSRAEYMPTSARIAVAALQSAKPCRDTVDDRSNQAASTTTKLRAATLHSAASSSGGRLWPSRRSTSSAASARLVPGPKIACTPAARSAA